jgi:hypothetical protein
MSRRPRNPVTVVKADIDDKRQRQLGRARNTFEDRERLRGRGRAQVTTEPVSSLADDRQLKDLISRGFSLETAKAMVEGKAPSPYRFAGHGS